MSSNVLHYLIAYQNVVINVQIVYGTFDHIALSNGSKQIINK